MDRGELTHEEAVAIVRKDLEGQGAKVYTPEEYALAKANRKAPKPKGKEVNHGR